MRRITTVRFALAAAVAATALAMPAPAPAADQIVCAPGAGFHPGVGFFFRRCGVPDFDQIRDDLPNDGKMYCFPTTALNWMAYAAERGWPDLNPGPGFTNPFPTEDEDTIVSAGLKVMGVLMGTHPTDGSTVSGVAAGLKTWTSGVPFGIHTVGPAAANLPFLETSMQNITATAANGSLTILRVGWWKKWATTLGIDRYFRVGGHAVSLVGAAPAPDLGADTSRIFIHDPAAAIDEPIDDSDDPEDITHQSPFWPGYYTTVPTLADFGIPSQSPLDPETRDRIVGYGDPGFVDGATFITPLFGLTFDPDPASGFSIAKPAAVDDGPDWVDLGALAGLIDVALAPFGAEHVAVFADGDIELLNSVDGSRRTLTTIPGAERAIFDDRGRLVVLTADGLVRLLGDGSADPGTGVPVPTEVDELAVDPTGDRLVGWDRSTNTLTSYGEDLEILDRQVLPPVGPPPDPETPVSLSVDPNDGTIGLLADGTNRLVVVTRTGAVSEVRLGDGAALEGLVADSSGRWYSTTQVDHRIVAFDRSGATVDASPFDGMRADRRFRIWQPMDIGELPTDDINVLPDDAPRQQRRLEVTGATNLVAAGRGHRVDVDLVDDTGAQVADRSLRWIVSGANAATGMVVTGTDGTATVAWPGGNVGTDQLMIWEDLDGDAVPDAGEPAVSRVASTVAEPVATATSVTAAPSPSTVGQAVTLTAQVSTPNGFPATGAVTFLERGEELGRAAVDHRGVATLTTVALPAGTHALTARYHGDDLFAPSEGRTTHAVLRIATRLVAHPLLVRFSPLSVTLQLSATLTDASGTPLAGRPVQFRVGDSTMCTGITGTDGRAVCQRTGIPLLLALLNLGYDAVYDGSATHSPSRSHGHLVG